MCPRHRPQGDWFCPLCVAQGITTKPQPLPLQPKQVRRAALRCQPAVLTCLRLMACAQPGCMPHRLRAGAGLPACLAEHTPPFHLRLLSMQVTALKPLKASKSRPGSSSKLSKAARESGGGGGASASQGGTPAAAPKAGGGGGGTGRVHMAAPTAPRAPRLGRQGGGARSNKNKRLFEGEEGALVNGQKLYYRTTQVGLFC